MKRKRYFVGDENKSPIYKITDDGCYYFCFIYDKWVRSLYSQNENNIRLLSWKFL